MVKVKRGWRKYSIIRRREDSERCEYKEMTRWRKAGETVENKVRKKGDR